MIRTRSRVIPLAAALVSACAFGLYLRPLAPTITWAHAGMDGGDLITAAATLGVAHPPGYPTYVALGHFFAQLPVGSIAFRLNLMSAVCMALAAGLTTLGIVCAAQSLGVAPLAGVIGGLTFAAAPMVWGQATIAEVHALNVLFVSVITWLLMPPLVHRQRLSTPRLALAFLMWGLGLGNLLTLAALLPIFIVAWRGSFQRERNVVRHSSFDMGSWLFFIPFLLGLSVYLLIPIRANGHPPVNWGNAVTLPRFLAQVTGELYRGYVFGLPVSDYPARLVAFAQLLVTQFGWPGLVLGAIGLERIITRPSKVWLAVASAVGLYTIFALGYNTADSDLYLIPVWMFGAWAVACGSLRLLRSLSRFRGALYAPPIVTAILVVLGPGWIVASHFAAIDLSAERSAETFADSVLSQAPRGAILVTGSDAHTFSLWYYRSVENRRPDTTIVDARLAGYDWYESMLVDQGRAPQLPSYEPNATWRARLASANPTRPVCEIDPATQIMRC